MSIHHFSPFVVVVVLASTARAEPVAAPSLSTAEAFLAQARQGKLSDTDAENAAALLDVDDPFVRAIAGWAIREKIGRENNGQVCVWPKPAASDWFGRWSERSAAAVIEEDYVHQAVIGGLTHSADKLLASAKQIVARAEQVACEPARTSATDDATPSAANQVQRLHRLLDGMADLGNAAPVDLPRMRKAWLDLRWLGREVVLNSRVVDFDQLIFVTRFGPHTVRNITRPFPWKHKPGGGLCVLKGLSPGGDLRNLTATALGPGHVRGLDLWWDADRVVFGYARQANWPPACDSRLASVTMRLRKHLEPMHLFEVKLDTGAVRQLTRDQQWSDFEPTYCANGNVVCVSDRCGRAPECGFFGDDMTTTNLYVVTPDGAVRHLTDNKDYDRYPHSLDNGAIAYTHWEYQERHFMEVHSIWTVRPDGTMADTLYKHHMAAPLALRDTRSIPGSHKLVAVATGHHTFAYGPIVIVNPTAGLNNPAGLQIVTPGVLPQEGKMAGQAVAEGGVIDRGGLYSSPWALSENCFLASYAYPAAADGGADSNSFGIYLIDVYGNKELLYRNPILGAECPIPLRARPRPPILPDARPAATPLATCYIPDVYEGLDGVARGSIKYVRIAQPAPWPFSPEKGNMPYMPDRAYAKQLGFANWAPVRVLGEARVEEDGSAYFQAPADTAIYFQALDERHMELRRMRSTVSLAPGETRGCPGCHEPRATALSGLSRPSLAMRDAPQTPRVPPWGNQRLLGYEWLVQPILDEHCVRCHGAKDAAGRLDLGSARQADGLMQSYHALLSTNSPKSADGKKLVPFVSLSNRFSNSAVTWPKEFGSHASRFIRILLDDDTHRREVQLTADQWLALVTWVDANAPYFDSFFDKCPAPGSPPCRVQPRYNDPFAARTTASADNTASH